VGWRFLQDVNHPGRDLVKIKDDAKICFGSSEFDFGGR